MSLKYESKLDPQKTYQAIEHIQKRFFEQALVKEKIWSALHELNGKVANKTIMDTLRKAVFPGYAMISHSFASAIRIEIYGNGPATFMDYNHKCYFEIPLTVPAGKTRPVLNLQSYDEFVKQEAEALAALQDFTAARIEALCDDYNAALAKLYSIYKLFTGELQYTVGTIFDPSADYRSRGEIFQKGFVSDE
jgi:hypothetical protein